MAEAIADETRALAYFHHVWGLFSQAAREAGDGDTDLDIGGTRLRVRFAGTGLEPMFAPALAPRRCPPDSEPAIEVGVWDSATTGIAGPDAPWRMRDVIVRGDVVTFSDERIRTLADPPNRTLTLWDAATRRGLYWAEDAERLPWWVHSGPLRHILHWALAAPGRHLVHAAAVGDGDAGALIIGAGRAGKSTTAFACLDAGMGWLSDDYVLVDLTGRPTAFSLYGTGKLTADSLALLPGLADAALVTDLADATTVFDLGTHRPGLLRSSAPIDALVIPAVAPGRARVRPVGAAEALRALAPSTVLQHGHHGAAGLEMAAELVRRVPAYALDLGDDIAAVAPAIRDLLAAGR